MDPSFFQSGDPLDLPDVDSFFQDLGINPNAPAPPQPNASSTQQPPSSSLANPNSSPNMLQPNQIPATAKSGSAAPLQAQKPPQTGLPRTEAPTSVAPPELWSPALLASSKPRAVEQAPGVRPGNPPGDAKQVRTAGNDAPSNAKARQLNTLSQDAQKKRIQAYLQEQQQRQRAQQLQPTDSDASTGPRASMTRLGANPSGVGSTLEKQQEALLKGQVQPGPALARKQPRSAPEPQWKTAGEMEVQSREQQLQYQFKQQQLKEEQRKRIQQQQIQKKQLEKQQLEFERQRQLQAQLASASGGSAGPQHPKMYGMETGRSGTQRPPQQTQKAGAAGSDDILKSLDLALAKASGGPEAEAQGASQAGKSAPFKPQTQKLPTKPAAYKPQQRVQPKTETPQQLQGGQAFPVAQRGALAADGGLEISKGASPPGPKLGQDEQQKQQQQALDARLAGGVVEPRENQALLAAEMAKLGETQQQQLVQWAKRKPQFALLLSRNPVEAIKLGLQIMEQQKQQQLLQTGSAQTTAQHQVGHEEQLHDRGAMPSAQQMEHHRRQQLEMQRNRAVAQQGRGEGALGSGSIGARPKGSTGGERRSPSRVSSPLSVDQTAKTAAATRPPHGGKRGSAPQFNSVANSSGNGARVANPQGRAPSAGLNLSHEEMVQRERKRRRLDAAPGNDQCSALLPDCTTPFRNKVDVWQRLVPFHVLASVDDEEAQPTTQQWQARVATVANSLAKHANQIHARVAVVLDTMDGLAPPKPDRNQSDSKSTPPSSPNALVHLPYDQSVVLERWLSGLTDAPAPANPNISSEPSAAPAAKSGSSGTTGLPGSAPAPAGSTQAARNLASPMNESAS